MVRADGEVRRLPVPPVHCEPAVGAIRVPGEPDVATFWQIFFAELYEISPTDRIIVDAGANVGAFSLYALLHAPNARVISVEPSTATFQRLRWVLDANGVADRATTIQAALGGSEGVTSFATTGPSHMRVGGVAGGEQVRQTTLESILPPNEQVDVLKMDIEGGEYPTLDATPRHVLDRIRRIELEYHPSFGKQHRWPALRQNLWRRRLRSRVRLGRRGPVRDGAIRARAGGEGSLAGAADQRLLAADDRARDKDTRSTGTVAKHRGRIVFQCHFGFRCL
jgi:FkbM family methyltransferase